jgi:hypothetical protein
MMDDDVQSHIRTSGCANTSYPWGVRINVLSTEITGMLSDSQNGAKSTGQQVNRPIQNVDEDLGESESELEDADLDMADLLQ